MATLDKDRDRIKAALSRLPSNEKEKAKKDSLEFRALSKGLGFFPASEPAPYRRQGTGAEAAGAPQFLLPTNRPAAPARMATVAPKPIPHPPPLEIEVLNVSPLRRLAAYTLDSLINLSLCGFFFLLALYYLKAPLRFSFFREFVLFAGAFLLVFNWAVILAQEIAFGTSIGKRIFGLGLVGSPAALFLRAFFFIFSLGFVGLGILWALFDRNHRCWHDLLTEVQPENLFES